MNGARQYAQIFKTGQYGRLYIVSSQHARGKTFRIQVLPKDEKAMPNGEGNLCLNENAVEVYGIIEGQPGWSESYGWLHMGPWQQDFYKLAAERDAESGDLLARMEGDQAKRARMEKIRAENLLAA